MSSPAINAQGIFTVEAWKSSVSQLETDLNSRTNLSPDLTPTLRNSPSPSFKGDNFFPACTNHSKQSHNPSEFSLSQPYAASLSTPLTRSPHILWATLGPHGNSSSALRHVPDTASLLLHTHSPPFSTWLFALGGWLLRTTPIGSSGLLAMTVWPMEGSSKRSEGRKSERRVFFFCPWFIPAQRCRLDASLYSRSQFLLESSPFRCFLWAPHRCPSAFPFRPMGDNVSPMLLAPGYIPPWLPQTLLTPL